MWGPAHPFPWPRDVAPLMLTHEPHPPHTTPRQVGLLCQQAVGHEKKLATSVLKFLTTPEQFAFNEYTRKGSPCGTVVMRLTRTVNTLCCFRYEKILGSIPSGGIPSFLPFLPTPFPWEGGPFLGVM